MPVVLRITVEGTACDAGVEDSLSLLVPLSGDLDLGAAFPFAPGLRNGDAVRLMTGGVCVREGGLLGRFMEGLSQEEKKSSACSAGVDAPSEDAVSTMSLMTTSSG